jgi:hypothetical protein
MAEKLQVNGMDVPCVVVVPGLKLDFQDKTTLQKIKPDGV